MNIDKYIQMNIDKISPNNKYTKFIKNRINLLLNLDLKIFYQILCAYSIYINDSKQLNELDSIVVCSYRSKGLIEDNLLCEFSESRHISDRLTVISRPL